MLTAMATPLADTIVGRLTAAFAAAADPDRAPAMAAYMRGRFPFLGIPTPVRRLLGREVLAGLDAPGPPDWRAVGRACWALPEREYQYFGADYACRYAAVGDLGSARHLIVTRSWWDTVDALAARLVGPLVRADPALLRTVDAWAAGDDVWLARAALLHQLRYREHTDANRLFGYCDQLADRPDFFIRKAIGWALREYARTAPAAVRDYVGSRRGRLSGLSVREAVRNL